MGLGVLAAVAALTAQLSDASVEAGMVSSLKLLTVVDVAELRPPSPTEGILVDGAARQHDRGPALFERQYVILGQAERRIKGADLFGPAANNELLSRHRDGGNNGHVLIRSDQSHHEASAYIEGWGLAAVGNPHRSPRNLVWLHGLDRSDLHGHVGAELSLRRILSDFDGSSSGVGSVIRLPHGVPGGLQGQADEDQTGHAEDYLGQPQVNDVFSRYRRPDIRLKALGAAILAVCAVALGVLLHRYSTLVDVEYKRGRQAHHHDGKKQS